MEQRIRIFHKKKWVTIEKSKRNEKSRDIILKLFKFLSSFKIFQLNRRNM